MLNRIFGVVGKSAPKNLLFKNLLSKASKAKGYQTAKGLSALGVRNVLPFIVGGAFTVYFVSEKKTIEAASPKVDYNQVKKDIAAIMDKDDNLGPTFVRLAWHASGTYSKVDNTGGSDGGRIRHSPEAKWGANAGLDVVRNALEPIKKKHPGISYADLYTLAGVAAIEEMGGPKINWRPGRTDQPDGKTSPPDGRLPAADKGSKESTIQHVRDIFYRMGFNDQEIVALLGAHALGRCHPDRSGYDGPWTKSPTTFSNWYYKELLDNKWTLRKWKGPVQYEDAEKTLMMLPADLAFVWDPTFKKFVELYAKDEQKFFDDFAKAFGKLLELGVKY